jgi:predicted nucleic acid-binding protein
VLYPAYLRDVLLRLAQAEIFQVRWSEQILDEMARNVKASTDSSLHTHVDRTIELMKKHFPEAMVTGYEDLIPSMTNHPEDRHVLAAAIEGRADLIVTSNLRHFPPESCEPHDIDVQPPDDFLCYQWDVGDPEYVVRVLRHWASQLSNPPLTLEQLLEILARSTPKFSETVLQFVRDQAR